MIGGLEWVEILKLACVGGVVAALANQIFKAVIDWFSDRAKRKTEAAYLAVRIVVALEHFVARCIDHIDDYEAGRSLEARPDRAGVLPRLSGLPSDADWRHFDAGLRFPILSLPTQVDIAQSRCDRVAWESRDFWASEAEAVRLGLVASLIAEKVRARYRMGRNDDLLEAIRRLNAKASELAQTRMGLRDQYLRSLAEQAAQPST